MFVSRSNIESDPFAALQAYKKRNIVELDFSQYKNWVDGDRLRCTNKSYLGKLFVCTIAASLRLMMMSRAQTNAKTAGLKIPKDSMEVLMAKLRGINCSRKRFVCKKAAPRKAPRPAGGAGQQAGSFR